MPTPAIIVISLVGGMIGGAEMIADRMASLHGHAGKCGSSAGTETKTNSGETNCDKCDQLIA